MSPQAPTAPIHPAALFRTAAPLPPCVSTAGGGSSWARLMCSRSLSTSPGRGSRWRWHSVGGLRTVHRTWASVQKHIIAHNPEATFHIFVATPASQPDCPACGRPLNCSREIEAIFTPYLRGHRCLTDQDMALRNPRGASVHFAPHHFLLFALIRASVGLAQDSGTDYDVVVRMRPDSHFFGSLRLLPLPSGGVAAVTNLQRECSAPAAAMMPVWCDPIPAAFVVGPRDIITDWFVSCPNSRAGGEDPLGSMHDQFFFGTAPAMYLATNITEEAFWALDPAGRHMQHPRAQWAVATEGLLYGHVVRQGLRPCLFAHESTQRFMVLAALQRSKGTEARMVAVPLLNPTHRALVRGHLLAPPPAAPAPRPPRPSQSASALPSRQPPSQAGRVARRAPPPPSGLTHSKQQFQRAVEHKFPQYTCQSSAPDAPAYSVECLNQAARRIKAAVQSPTQAYSLSFCYPRHIAEYYHRKLHDLPKAQRVVRAKHGDTNRPGSVRYNVHHEEVIKMLLPCALAAIWGVR